MSGRQRSYYNPVFGRLKISKQKEHLLLHIGPIGIIWRLTYCQNNVFKAYWPNPYGMKFTMLPMDQNSVEFIERKNKEIHKMIIPFLNGDGSGVFEGINTETIQHTHEL